MTLTITINMDGAAFENPNYGIERVLSKLLNHIMDARFITAGFKMSIRDINGKKCGSLTVTETEEN